MQVNDFKKSTKTNIARKSTLKSYLIQCTFSSKINSDMCFIISWKDKSFDPRMHKSIKKCNSKFKFIKIFKFIIEGKLTSTFIVKDSSF